jgi:general secretion pathway protein G
MFYSVSKRPSGFSLVEIMVVLVIIGLLAGVVTLNVRHFMIKGKQSTAKMEISTICSALETFYSTYGRYPTNEEGLDVLSQKSDKLPEPLLRQMPIDPWNRRYQYNCPGQSEPYEVICLGADGREGGDGADADIVSWKLKDEAAMGGK